MNTAATLHIISTRPSVEIFSRMISFLEKERKQKQIISTKETERK